MLFLSITQLYAQSKDYIFRHITVNDGLVNNKVTVICQDRQGFIWAGTQAGLQRYDGTRFKNYLADIRDTAALQSDWISAIFEDSKNRLWIGTDHGAPYILNRSTGKFYNYNFHTTAGNKINGVWNFAEDKAGNIWMAGHDGYYKLNDATNQFEKYNATIGLDKNIKTGYLTIDKDDNIWLATTGGVKLYNQQEKKLYGKEHNPLHNPLFDIKEGVANMVRSGNYLWISAGFYRIVYQYNFMTRKLKAFTFDKLPSKKLGPDVQKEIVGEIFCLKNGETIVPLMERGFAVYHPEADSFFIVNADNTKQYAYHTNENNASRICIAEDREGNILLGNEAGISVFNLQKQLFQTYDPGAEKGKFFPEAAVTDFLQLKDGNILIGYYHVNGGIVKTDSTFHFIKHYLINENGNKNSYSNQVWGLFNDEKGIVWAPNQRYSILKLNPVTEAITDEKDSILSGPIVTIKQDSPDVIWIGHWKKGLVKVNTLTHRKYFYTQFLFSDSNNIKRVQSILLDGDKIWVGTLQNGLQVFDKKKEKFVKAFVTDEKNKTAISSNSVTDILRYNRDTLIIATEMGVNIFDIKSNTFRAITVKEGLPNNIVQAIMADTFGNLWVACGSGGFCKINRHNFNVTGYDINDGITDNSFTSKFYRLYSGKTLIGVSSGFISFNPSAFTISDPPPDVLVTGVHVFEKELMMDSILKNHHPLTLSHRENSLRVEFASLQFWSPGSIQYFYKLEGVDNDWIAADKNHTAIYNQLKDGQYLFSVKCANREGVFCIHTTELKIIIKPPFWKTWWFLLAAFSAIILLVYSVLQRRIKNIRAIGKEKLKVQELTTEKYSIQAQLSKARLEALRSQMNPHFIFNSLNAIQECILTNKTDAAYEYLSKFSKLQRMVLNNSEKELIPLSSEIEMLRLYLSLESLRFNKSFTCHIDTASITDTDEIMIPSLITQPFVENAIWHGLQNKEGEKELLISFKEINGRIIISIDDNGVGREKAEQIKNEKITSNQYASKGSALSSGRILLLNQQYNTDIKISYIDKKDLKGVASGTTLVITLPNNLSTLYTRL